MSKLFDLDKVLPVPDGDIDVLAIGECLVDLISENYENPLDKVVYNRHFGGSTGNVAINASRLGCKTCIISNLGADPMGKFLLDTLRKNNVDTSGVNMDHEHRTSMVLINKIRGTVSFSPYRDADMHIRISDNEIKLAESARIIHFSTWPLSWGTSRSAALSLLQSAKSMGKLLCFDPNYRRILWEKDHDGAEFIKQVIGIADIIKPSADDARHLFGEDSYENYMERFLELGAGLVILTTGKEGAMVSGGTTTRSFSSLAEGIEDTIGAGDAFWAGFYTGLLRGKTISRAVQAGMAASSYNLKVAGSLAELPLFEELERRALRVTEQHT